MQAAVAMISVTRSIYNKLSFHCHVIYISKIKVFVFVFFHVTDNAVLQRPSCRTLWSRTAVVQFLTKVLPVSQ